MLFAILPPAAREIGLSPFQVSTIFAASATIWVFVSPLWGRRSDVIGRRRVILIGLLGFALSMTLLATMIAIGRAGLLPVLVVYPLMVASRCVFALIGSGTGPAAQAYVADRTSAAERTAGVALINAANGLGQTIGPATGAALAVVGVLTPIYFAAGLAVVSAVAIWGFLPESGPPPRRTVAPEPRLSFRDPRVVPFIAIGASLQAVQATTTITLAFFLQDTLHLSAQAAVQHAGVGFMVLAAAGLFAQLVVVQRYRPSPRRMLRTGVPLIALSYVVLVGGDRFAFHLVALAMLGLGIGLTRPGNAAAASLAVPPYEQGAVAGLLSGIVVVGNIFGPLLGTAVFEVTPTGPYLINAGLMALVSLFVFTRLRLR